MLDSPQCFSVRLKGLILHPMQRSHFLIWISLLLAVGSTAQDTVNVVSDSAFNAFILNHKPLTAGELNRFRLERDYKNVYGIYVSTYLNDPSTYPIQQKAMGTYVTKRRVNHIEWIFYSFAGLFLLLALIRNFWREYFDKVFLVYFNQGFILRQKKDAMMMWSLPSVLLNLLFVLSASFFIFFGLGSNYKLTGLDRWQTILFILLILSFVYFFKYFFLQFLGWMFRQREVFEQYSFVVFLNNKIVGVVMLVASFIMAFSGKSSYGNIFNLVLYIVGILFLIRILNAFRIFSLQTKAGIFNILIAFISVEILPTAMLIKFASQSIFLLTGGAL
jgi:hypothetical protein